MDASDDEKGPAGAVSPIRASGIVLADSPENSVSPSNFQRFGDVALALIGKIARQHGLRMRHALALADAGLARGVSE